MINPTLPEVKHDPAPVEEPIDSDESIIYHTEIADPPEKGINKFLLLFKRKASAADEGEMPAGTDAPVAAEPPAVVERRPNKRAERRVKPKAKDPGPDMRLRAFMSPPMSLPPEKEPKKFSLKPTRERTHRAYWDVAGTFSLIVNAILIAVLVIMAGQIKNMKSMISNLLGGLYGNFVEMDKASITTTIPVEAQIPLSFSLPISQNTDVTLTSPVTIRNTGVVINSGPLSINSPATITLPEGTGLPIALKMDIPVQLTIPVSLQIPVNIPMNQTSLHTPFTGLQQVIRPLYCTINKNAQYPDGIYICGPQTSPSAGNP
jgi:hypothetical protein